MSLRFSHSLSESDSSTGSAHITHANKLTGAKEPEIPLTFGVEFEFLFCVSESLVNRDAQHWLHIELDQKSSMSRAPQQIARILEARNGLPVVPEPNPNDVEYDHWTVTTEEAASLRSRRELLKWSTRANKENLEDWHCRGLELISRILDAPDYKCRQLNREAGSGRDVKKRGNASRNPLPSIPPKLKHAGSMTHPNRGGKRTRKQSTRRSHIQEVGTYLDAITSRPTDPFFFIAVPENSSIHVHLGVPNRGQFHEPSGLRAIPLPILKHLAFIIILFEDIISAFHDPERRGWADTKTAGVAQSNRFGLTKTYHICGRMPKLSREYIEHAIFTCNTIAELGQLMDNTGSPGEHNRWKFVNWQNLFADPKPRTLEFRQHTGTRNGEDVAHWVRFIVALFRAAERKYHQQTPPVSPRSSSGSRDKAQYAPSSSLGRRIGKTSLEGNQAEDKEANEAFYEKSIKTLEVNMRQALKYNWPTEGQKLREIELFDLLDLDRKDREYWTWRMEDYDKEEYRKRYAFEHCTGCLYLHKGF